MNKYTSISVQTFCTVVGIKDTGSPAHKAVLGKLHLDPPLPAQSKSHHSFPAGTLFEIRDTNWLPELFGSSRSTDFKSRPTQLVGTGWTDLMGLKTLWAITPTKIAQQFGPTAGETGSYLFFRFRIQDKFPSLKTMATRPSFVGHSLKVKEESNISDVNNFPEQQFLQSRCFAPH